METPVRTLRLAQAAVAVLAVVLLFYGLGDNGLHTLDEARHAVVAENLMQAGGGAELSYRGEPYVNKPPLKFWLTAATFRLWGVDAWTARLWSALFGLGAVGATYLLGRRLFGPGTGLIAALALTTSAQFLYTHGARTGELDSALLCWFTLALALLWNGARRDRDLYLGCLVAGLAGLTKHLAFTAEILAIWGLWCAVAGPKRRPRLGSALRGLLLAVAVALPWHLGAAARVEGFWNGYFGREVLTRAAGAGGDSVPPLAYLTYLKDGLFPWSWLLPAAGWSLLRRREGGRAGPWLLLSLWIAVVGLVIGAGGVKFSWYALPAYPALCVATAALVTGPCSRMRTGWLLISGVLAAFSVTNATTFNPFLSPAMDGGLEVDLGGRLGGRVPVWMATWIITTAVIWGFAAAVRRRRPGRLSPGSGWIVAGLLAVALAYVVPPLQYALTPTPLASFAEGARRLLPEGAAVRLWLPGGRDRTDLEVYYLRRLGPVRMVDGDEPAGFAILGPELGHAPPGLFPSTPRPDGRILLGPGSYELRELSSPLRSPAP